jgi:outer membrane lipoprotein-sorting protein
VSPPFVDFQTPPRPRRRRGSRVGARAAIAAIRPLIVAGPIERAFEAGEQRCGSTAQGVKPFYPLGLAATLRAPRRRIGRTQNSGARQVFPAAPAPPARLLRLPESSTGGSDMTHPTHHRHTLRALLIGVTALGLGLPLAAQDAALTVEELIEKNLEAKGGRATIEGVQSARVTGKMNMGGMEAPFVYQWKAPDRIRIEFTIQGMTGIQAFDGENGWTIMPFMGKTDPEKMSAEDAAQLADDADFRGQLFDPGEKGYTVEYAGEEEVEGTPTYKLRLTKEDGGVSHLYLDQEYFLEIKQDSKRTLRGQDVETQTAVGDYKEVSGLLVPHSHDITSSLAPGQSQTMIFEVVELNVEIPDERFTMPEPAPAEEGEGEGEGGGR